MVSLDICLLFFNRSIKANILTKNIIHSKITLFGTPWENIYLFIKDPVPKQKKAKKEKITHE